MGDRETMSCVTRAVITFLETSLCTSSHPRTPELQNTFLILFYLQQ